MGSRFTRLLAVGAVATALAAGAASAAFAADADEAGAPPPPPPRGPRLPVPLSALGEFFGLSGDQVRADLRSGESLAQIAAAQGKSTADLKAFVLAEAKEYLDDAVTAGRIS